ncbi:MAG: tetraacyldisaccharide 4'-kinase, partial [Chitinophagales bacterium]
MNILLTDYHNRYTQDHIAPIGRLREGRSGAKRADIIIVSKCPDELSASEKNTIRQEIKPLPHQIVCYSHLKYQAPYPIQRLMANFANATN